MTTIRTDEGLTLFDVAPLIRAPSPGSIQHRFNEFHDLNPWVYAALVSLARDLVGRGRRRIGVKMLVEVLRWHYWRQTVDPSSDFKLSNSYTSRYARKIVNDEPDLADAIELRTLRAE